MQSHLLKQRFIRETNRARRKKLGQFFTPENIAQWMASWVLQNEPKNVLDPALGLGALSAALLKKRKDIKIFGVEKDKTILQFLDEDLSKLVDVKNIDYFDLDAKLKYEAIIANPPYIRHHEYNLSKDIVLKYKKICGEKISGLSNIYLFFCIDLIHRLEKNGRAAIIIPTDWMNANFGHPLKRYLSKLGVLKLMLYLDSNTLVFENNLSTASILFIEKGNKKYEAVDFYYVNNIDFFSENNPNKKKYKNHAEYFQYSWRELNNTNKWDSLFRKRKNTIRYKDSKSIGDFFSSKRGIATGANKFFNINIKDKEKYCLDSKSLKLCIGSSRDVEGLVFKNQDLKNKLSQNKKLYLFDPPSKLNKSDRDYIELGKQQNIHLRYLPANKKIWYQQEKREIAPIWVGVFNRGKVRFIYNETNSICLTTFHALYPIVHLTKLEIKALVFILNHEYSLDLILDQRRTYGDGLAKLEPRDLLDISTPNIKKIKEEKLTSLASRLDVLDKAYRANKEYSSNLDIEELVEWE